MCRELGLTARFQTPECLQELSVFCEITVNSLFLVLAAESERASKRENSELYYSRIKILGSCLFLQSVPANLHANERERDNASTETERFTGLGNESPGPPPCPHNS